jgi:hypothetical protein
LSELSHPEPPSTGLASGSALQLSDPDSDFDSDSDSEPDLSDSDDVNNVIQLSTPSQPTTVISPPMAAMPPIITQASSPPIVIPPHQFYGSETYNYILHLEKQLNYHKTHCTMLVTEYQNLKRKVNHHESIQSNKRQKVVTNAQMLTSEEGLWLAEEQEAE